MSLRFSFLATILILAAFCTATLAPPLRDSSTLFLVQDVLLFLLIIVIINVVHECYLTWKIRRLKNSTRMSSGRVAAMVVAVLLYFYFCITVVSDSFIRGEPVIKDAVRVLALSPTGHSLFGEKLGTGWPISGEYELVGRDGSATLSIPVSGDRQRGTMYLHAEKRGGSWSIVSMDVVSSRDSEKQPVIRDGEAQDTGSPRGR